MAIKDRRGCELKKQPAGPCVAIADRGARIRTTNVAAFPQYHSHTKREIVIPASDELIDPGHTPDKPRWHKRSTKTNREGLGHWQFGIHRIEMARSSEFRINGAACLGIGRCDQGRKHDYGA
jgi:hypothetical protein